jgi:DNA-directed RNA polymerase beta' subunit
MADTKTFLANGVLTKVPANKEPDYKFISPASFFSSTTNLIPQLSGVSGGRVLLGDKASLQSISLDKREAPLVQSADNDESFVKTFAKPMAAVFSKVAGKVKSIDNNSIVVDKESHDIYDNFLTGQKSAIHHTPVVKVGDTVKKGDLLATSNFTDSKGNLALGVNLTTAVMPFRSLNFEDAYVVTEAGAKKLGGEQMFPLTVEKERGLDFNKNKFISLFPNKYYNNQLGKIDDDGVIKKGTIVKHGDPLVLSFEPRTLKTTDAQLGNLSGILKNAFTDRSHKWEYDSDGEVVDVAKTNKHVTMTLKTKRPVVAGDKISAFGGNKGVISRILPMSETPTLQNGEPVDVILNSMSIVSRVAPSVLTSMALGKVAQKTGKSIKVKSFTDKSQIEEAQKALKEHNLSDMEDVYDPISSKTLNVFVGPLFLNRLVHISEDKLSNRGHGISYDTNQQPSKANHNEAAKRLGNLGTNVLLSHSARHVLEDAAVIKGTKNDEYWRALKLGHDLPAPKIPFIFDKFISHLEGAGIKIQRDGSKFNVLPQTDKDIEEKTKGEIDNPDGYKIKSGELVFEKGGFFDIDKIGINGDNYNHINLKNPIINPISEDYIRKTLGVTQKQFDELVGKGELVDKVKAIDTDKKIKDLEIDLKSARKTDRDNKIKVLGFLKNLKRNDIKLSDLVLTKVPVIPAKYRPLIVQGGRVISSGVNELYRDLMLVNQDISHMPEEEAQDVRKSQYNAVKAVYGLGDPISTRNMQKNFKGLLASALGFQGGSAKSSLFQSRVVNKPMDLVGRAVLTPDSNLDINEASLPHDMVWKMYNPFVIKRLVQSGVPAVNAKEYVEGKHPLALEHLKEELKERPVLIGRDPQISRWSSQGFMAKLNSDPHDSTLKLNPLLAKGFGADHDGDALLVSVPVGDAARKEVLQKMMPSKNLLSNRNFTPVYVPSNEAALGLYLASTEKNVNPHKKYNSEKEVVKAYNKGELNLGDQVVV